ncbi:MAG TPA: AraC family transcriptional regulator [Bacillus bacterium]|nr:AraC family transcriptional regulator [Bacillus sp. (in: firmicutes)]
MDYEIVQLEEKKVAGLKIRTNNSDPNMSTAIGDAWKKFFEDGTYQSIPDKKNDKCIGLYTNYTSNVNGDYDVVVCCEIHNTSNSISLVHSEIIPAGKYAKFIIHGHVQKAVAEFWMKLWSMDLDRKFSGDFEEYQGCLEPDNVEVHIYISLN